MDWFEQASCKGMDTDMFFADRGPNTRQMIKNAKAVCKNCPVIQPCLNFAIETDSKHGIFGGLSPKERRSERWKRQAVNIKSKK